MNEEKVEELDVIEDIKEDKNSDNIEEIVNDDISLNDEKKSNNEIESIDESNNEEVISETNIDEENIDSNNVYVPMKNKKLIIILLSIFLVLDISVLVIYLIGIDKVFSFIK